MNVYVSGTRVRSEAQFVDASGAAADPDVTTFTYRPGTDAPTTVAPTKDSTGVYHYDIDTSGFAGPDLLLYACQWEGTGAVQVIGDDYFQVKPPAL